MATCAQLAEPGRLKGAWPRVALSLLNGGFIDFHWCLIDFRWFQCTFNSRRMIFIAELAEPGSLQEHPMQTDFRSLQQETAAQKSNRNRIEISRNHIEIISKPNRNRIDITTKSHRMQCACVHVLKRGAQEGCSRRTKLLERDARGRPNRSRGVLNPHQSVPRVCV